MTGERWEVCGSVGCRASALVTLDDGRSWVCKACAAIMRRDREQWERR